MRNKRVQDRLSTTAIVWTEKCEVKVDGMTVQAYLGESVAGLMHRMGRQVVRRSTRYGTGRGYFCGMGICYECVVRLDHVAVRGCLAFVQPGVSIETMTIERPDELR